MSRIKRRSVPFRNALLLGAQVVAPMLRDCASLGQSRDSLTRRTSLRTEGSVEPVTAQPLLVPGTTMRRTTAHAVDDWSAPRIGRTMRTTTLGRLMAACGITALALMACSSAPDSEPAPGASQGALEEPACTNIKAMCDVTQHSDGTWWQNTYCSSWRPVGRNNYCPGGYNSTACPVKQVTGPIYYDSSCGLHQNPNAGCPICY